MSYYRDYIQSDEWKEKRAAALERSRSSDADAPPFHRPPRCEMCGKNGGRHTNSRSSLDPRERRFRVDDSYGLQVHHVHYRTLGNEDPDDLIVLCTNRYIHEAGGRTTIIQGCHERAHEDVHYRSEVAHVAGERRYF